MVTEVGFICPSGSVSFEVTLITTDTSSLVVMVSAFAIGDSFPTTVTVTTAVSQFVGFKFSQIEYTKL